MAKEIISLIVKPTDRSGSRGIFKVEQKEDLKSAVARAMGESFEKKVLIEEYAEGDEYSVEYISYQGKHYFLALTKKYTSGEPKFIETGHLEPASVSEVTMQKVLKVIEKALDSLKIKNGASHSEIKIDQAGNIKIIEIGGRMGGDCIGSDLVHLSTGYDFVDMVIDIACGKPLNFVRTKECSYAFVRFIFNETDIIKMNKLQELLPHIFYRISDINVIDKNRDIDDSSQRFGYYILSTLNKNELNKAIELIGK